MAINKAISERVADVSSQDYRALQDAINKGLKSLTSTFVMPVSLSPPGLIPI